MKVRLQRLKEVGKQGIALGLMVLMTVSSVVPTYAINTDDSNDDNADTSVDNTKKDTETPVVTEAPVETSSPEATVEPQATAVPQETAAPKETAAPVATTVPEATVAPVETAQPEKSAEPEVTAQPEETAEPEDAEKATDTDENKETKTEYTYDDSKLTATATLSDASAIPDDAKFKVEVLPYKGNESVYTLYVSALNNIKGTIYTEKDIKLYDMSFTKDGKELEPAKGTVSVEVTSKDGNSIYGDETNHLLHMCITDTVALDKYKTTLDAAKSGEYKSDDIVVRDIGEVKDNSVTFKDMSEMSFVVSMDAEHYQDGIDGKVTGGIPINNGMPVHSSTGYWLKEIVNGGVVWTWKTLTSEASGSITMYTDGSIPAPVTQTAPLGTVRKGSGYVTLREDTANPVGGSRENYFFNGSEEYILRDSAGNPIYCLDRFNGDMSGNNSTRSVKDVAGIINYEAYRGAAGQRTGVTESRLTTIVKTLAYYSADNFANLSNEFLDTIIKDRTSSFDAGVTLNESFINEFKGLVENSDKNKQLFLQWYAWCALNEAYNPFQGKNGTCVYEVNFNGSAGAGGNKPIASGGSGTENTTDVRCLVNFRGLEEHANDLISASQTQYNPSAKGVMRWLPIGQSFTATGDEAKVWYNTFSSEGTFVPVTNADGSKDEKKAVDRGAESPDGHQDGVIYKYFKITENTADRFTVKYDGNLGVETRTDITNEGTGENKNVNLKYKMHDPDLDTDVTYTINTPLENKNGNEYDGHVGHWYQPYTSVRTEGQSKTTDLTTGTPVIYNGSNQPRIVVSNKTSVNYTLKHADLNGYAPILGTEPPYRVIRLYKESGDLDHRVVDNSNYSLDGITYTVYKDPDCKYEATDEALGVTSAQITLHQVPGNPGLAYSDTLKLRVTEATQNYYIKEDDPSTHPNNASSRTGYQVDTEVHKVPIVRYGEANSLTDYYYDHVAQDHTRHAGHTDNATYIDEAIQEVGISSFANHKFELHDDDTLDSNIYKADAANNYGTTGIKQITFPKSDFKDGVQPAEPEIRVYKRDNAGNKIFSDGKAGSVNWDKLRYNAVYTYPTKEKGTASETYVYKSDNQGVTHFDNYDLVDTDASRDKVKVTNNIVQYYAGQLAITERSIDEGKYYLNGLSDLRYEFNNIGETRKIGATKSSIFDATGYVTNGIVTVNEDDSKDITDSLNAAEGTKYARPYSSTAYFINVPKYGGIYAEKTDGDLGNKTASGESDLSGAIFTVYNSSGRKINVLDQVFNNGDAVLKIKTNAYGEGQYFYQVNADGSMGSQITDKTVYHLGLNNSGNNNNSEQTQLVAWNKINTSHKDKTTGNAHQIEVPMVLPEGVYSVKETTIPKGYTDRTPQEYNNVGVNAQVISNLAGGYTEYKTGTAHNNVTSDDGETDTGALFQNRAIRGGVYIDKRDGLFPDGDAYSKDADWTGIKFDIINRSTPSQSNNNGTVRVNGKDYAVGQVVATIETKKGVRDNGTIFYYATTASDFKDTTDYTLPYGTYEIRERHVNQGKDANGNPIPVTTDKDANYVNNDLFGTYKIVRFSIRNQGEVVKKDVNGNQIVFGNENNGIVLSNSGDVNYTYGNSNITVRQDLHFDKRIETAGQNISVPWILWNQDTGEAHIIVTDTAGSYYSENSHHTHSYHTNANDNIAARYGINLSNPNGYDWQSAQTISENALDRDAGTWFGLGKVTDNQTKMAAVRNDLPALSKGHYRLIELKSDVNKDYNQVIFSFIIGGKEDKPLATYDLGTITDTQTEFYSDAKVTTNTTMGDKYLPSGKNQKFTDTVNWDRVQTHNVLDGESKVDHVWKYRVREELYYAEDSANHHAGEKVDPSLYTVTLDKGQKGISADGTFQNVNTGSMKYTFTIKDSSEFEGEVLVVYAYLDRMDCNPDTGVDTDWKVYATDTNTSNYRQRIYIPGIATDASEVAQDDKTLADVTLDTKSGTGAGEFLGNQNDTDLASGTRLIKAGTKVTVKDTMQYRNLSGGQTYRAISYVVPKDEAETNIDDLTTDYSSYTRYLHGLTARNDYTGSKVVERESNSKSTNGTTFNLYDFTAAESGNGSVDLSYTFDVDTELMNKDLVLVVFVAPVMNGVAQPVLWASHADLSDERETLHVPEVQTVAMDDATKDNVGVVSDNDVVIKDTVEYKNVIPGLTYTIQGKLVNKENEQDILNRNGQLISDTTTFKANAKDGKVVLTYTVPSSEYEGETVTSYVDMRLTSTGSSIAEHMGVRDNVTAAYPTSHIKTKDYFTFYKQDIHYPKVETEAVDSRTGDHVGSIFGTLINNVRQALGEKDVSGNGIADNAEQTIIDTVTIKNLLPGMEYQLQTVLANADTKKVIEGVGTTDQTATITVGNDGHVKTSGSIKLVKEDASHSSTVDLHRTDATFEVRFNVDSSKIQGVTTVVISTLKHKGINVYQHDDYRNVRESVNEVSIDTTAIDVQTGDHVGDTPKKAGTFNNGADPNLEERDSTVIKDTVNMTKLVKDMKYTVHGYLAVSENEHLDSYVEDGTDLVRYRAVSDKYGLDNIKYVKADGTLTSNKEEAVQTSVDFTANPTNTVLKGYKETVQGHDGHDGKNVGFDVTGYVELTFPAISASAIEGKTITVVEDLYHTGPTGNNIKINTHTELDDKDQMVHYPSVRTTAFETSDTQDDVGRINNSVTITDDVYYSGLLKDQQYEIFGKLVYQQDYTDDKGNIIHHAGDDFLDGHGTPVTARAVLEAGKHETSGMQKLAFVINANDLAGQTLVAFEDLTHNGVKVTTHSNLKDNGETINYAKVTTHAADALTNDHVGTIFGNVINQLRDWTKSLTHQGDSSYTRPDYQKITDTVQLDNLVPGRTYVVGGKLMDRATRSEITNADGSVVRRYAVIKVAKDGSKIDILSTGNNLTELGKNPKANGDNSNGSSQNAKVLKYQKDYDQVDGSIEMSYIFDSAHLVNYGKYSNTYTDGRTIVVYETLYHTINTSKDAIDTWDVSGHTDIADNKQAVNDVSIQTEALDKATGDHVGDTPRHMGDTSTGVNTFGKVTDETTSTIVETISMDKLVDGATYMVNGALAVKEDSTNENPMYLKADGTLTSNRSEAIQASKTFVAKKDTTKKDGDDGFFTESGNDGMSLKGTVKLEFVVPKDTVEDKTIVVLDDLYHNGVLITTHSDINNEFESVHYPKLRTTASDTKSEGTEFNKNENGTKDDVGTVNSVASVTDVVKFNNLMYNESYTVQGVLVYQEDFTDALGNKHKAGDVVPILNGDEGGVDYTQDGKSDSISVTLNSGNFESDKRVNVTNKSDKNSVDGTVTITFKLNSDLLEGTTTVAFEKLTHNNVKVDTHADINDKPQTVHYPKVETELVDSRTGDHVGSIFGSLINGIRQWLDENVGANDKQQVVDTVKLYNLVPGRTYTINGRLMDQNASDHVLRDMNGKEMNITQTVTFKVADNGKSLQITGGNGTEPKVVSYDTEHNSVDASIKMTYTLDSSMFNNVGKTLVAFEDLLHNNVTVNYHHDIGDNGQSVNDVEIHTTGTEIKMDYTDNSVEKPGQSETPSVATNDHVGDVPRHKTTFGTNTDALGIKDETASRIQDVVQMNKLVDGMEYTLKGYLIDKGASTKDSPAYLRADGTTTTDRNDKNIVTTSRTFTANSLTLGNYKADADISAEEVAAVMGKNYVAYPGARDVFSVNGTITLTFPDLTPETLEGRTIVVFEDLYHANADTGTEVKISTHSDLNDENQSVHYPKMRTHAVDVNTKDDVGKVTDQKVIKGTTTVNDTVTYWNLLPDQEYTVHGVLVYQTDFTDGYGIHHKQGERLKDYATGKVITNSATLKAGNHPADGSVVIPFEVDSNLLQGGSVVTFEELIHNKAVVDTHTDIHDESQTNHYPKLRTTLIDGDTGDKVGSIFGQAINAFRNLIGNTDYEGAVGPQKIEENKVQTVIDTVKLTNLIPGKEYTVKGKLMDRDSGTELKIDGKSITQEATITVSADGKKITAKNGEKTTVTKTDMEYMTVDGTVDLTFKFDSSKLNNHGKTVVAYEDLYHNGVMVVAHEDLKDQEQSVNEVEMHSEAVDSKTNDHIGQSVSDSDKDHGIKTSTIVDTVDLTKLVKGMDYTIVSRLVDQGESNADKVVYFKNADGVEIYKTLTFRPEEDGSFTILDGQGNVIQSHVETDTHIERENEDKTPTVQYDDIKFSADGKLQITYTIDSELVQGKTLTVFDDLYHKGVKISTHGAGLRDGKLYTEPTQTVYYPTGKTNATDNKTTVHSAMAEKVTITDRVYVQNLVAGEKYTISGKLMNKATSEALGIDGSTAEVTFTGKVNGKTVTLDGAKIEDAQVFTWLDGTNTYSGYIPLTFTFDASSLAGQTVVAFETFKHNDVDIFSHADINDLPQTVKIPKLETTAHTLDSDEFDEASVRQYDEDTKEYKWNNDLVVKDKVEYSNLWTEEQLKKMHEEGLTVRTSDDKVITDYDGNGNTKEIRDGKVYDINEHATYVIVGVLVDKKTGEPIIDNDGNKVAAYAFLQPTESDGTIDLEYHLDLSKFVKLDKDGKTVVDADNNEINRLEGKSLVVYENLYQLFDKTELPNEVSGTLTQLPGEKADSDKGIVETVKDAVESVIEKVTKSDVASLDDVSESNHVATHEDVNDVKQDIRLPKGRTHAVDSNEEIVGSDDAEKTTENVTETDDRSVEDTTEIANDAKTDETVEANAEEENTNETVEETDKNTESDTDKNTETEETEKNVLGHDAKDLGKHELLASDKMKITDTVSYEDLHGGTEYTVTGVLHIKDEDGKDAGVALDDEGKEITVTKTFTTDGEYNDEVSGTVDLVFEFSGLKLAGKTLVAFETFEREGVKVIVHTNINDHPETVHVPEIKTNAWGLNTPEDYHEVMSDGTHKAVVYDKVTYKNLKSGHKYVMKGKLVYQTDDANNGIHAGDVVKDKNGNEVTAEQEFIAGQSDVWYTDAVNPEDADKIVDEVNKTDESVEGEEAEDTTKVVDEAKETDTEETDNKNSETAVPTETANTETTMQVESIEEVKPTETEEQQETDTDDAKGTDVEDTKETDAKDVDESKDTETSETKDAKTSDVEKKTVETVKKTDDGDIKAGIAEKVGDKNVLSELIDKVKNLKNDNGKVVIPEEDTTTHGYTGVNGTVTLKFVFDSDLLEGKTVVVFEDLYNNNKHVATHNDITDENQSVNIPKVRTTAKDTTSGKSNGNPHKQYADANAEITDTVRFNNLQVGKAYNIKGTLMLKETGKKLEINGKPVEAKTTLSYDSVKNNPDTVLSDDGRYFSGSVDLKFTLNTEGMEGKHIVAFEKLYRNGILVGAHEDLNDTDQTIEIEAKPNTGDITKHNNYGIYAAIGLALVTVLIAVIEKRKKDNAEDAQ